MARDASTYSFCFSASIEPRDNPRHLGKDGKRERRRPARGRHHSLEFPGLRHRDEQQIKQQPGKASNPSTMRMPMVSASPAEVAGQHAERHADREAERDRHHGDGHQPPPA